MLGRVLVCVALVLPFACSGVLPEGGKAPPYFIHPKDRKSGDLTPRIIGGDEVKPHSYPFQVSLLLNKGSKIYFCGGTLLNNYWVLTAAHCVDMKPDYILVGLGEHNLTNIDIDTAIVQNATKYVAHSGWNETTFQNDVAVIKLPQKVTFTKYIQPVNLASGSDKYAGKKATIIGWGQTETESLSYVLKGVNTTVMTNDDCANMNINYKEIIKPMHICSSGTGNVGICDGDSGGPLIVNGVQVGITSFGTTNCQLSMPSVFTRVTEFRSWISQHAVGGASVRESFQFSAIVLITLCFSYLFK